MKGKVGKKGKGKGKKGKYADGNMVLDNMGGGGKGGDMGEGGKGQGQGEWNYEDILGEGKQEQEPREWKPLDPAE